MLRFSIGPKLFPLSALNLITGSLKCLIVFPPGDKHIIAGSSYLWINGIGGGTITQVNFLSKCNAIIVANPVSLPLHAR